MHGQHCKLERRVVTRILSEGMLPIMTPTHNMREICKELTLLEDHLNQPGKRCPDCITKHFLKCEALAEEGISLCDEGDELSSLLERSATLIREWLVYLLDSEDYHGTARKLRMLRKRMMPMLVHTV